MNENEICLTLDDQSKFQVLCYNQKDDKQKDNNHKVVLELNGTSDFIVVMNIKGILVEMAKGISTNLSIRCLGRSRELTKQTVEKSSIDNKPTAQVQQQKPNPTIKIIQPFKKPNIQIVQSKIENTNHTEPVTNGEVNQDAQIGEQFEQAQNGGMISQEKLLTKPSQVDDQQNYKDPQIEANQSQQQPYHPEPNLIQSTNSSKSQTHESQQTSTTSQQFSEQQLDNQNKPKSDAQENSNELSLPEFAKALENNLFTLQKNFKTQTNELLEKQVLEWKMKFYVLIQELKQLVASSQLEKGESQETNLTSASTDQHIDRVKQQSVANTSISETKPNHLNLSTAQPLTTQNDKSVDSTEITEESSKNRQQNGLSQSTNLGQTNPSTSRLTSGLTDKSVDIPTLLGPFRKVSDNRQVQAHLKDFVGYKVPIEYYYDEFYGTKRERLKDQFKKLGILHYRSIRGDGNCFYTALGFRLLEVLIKRFGGVGLGQLIQDLKFQPIQLDQYSLVTKEEDKQLVKNYLCQCIGNVQSQNHLESLFKCEEKFLFYEAFTIFIRSLVFERRQSVIGQETDLGSLALMVEPEGVLTWEEECSNFIEVIIRIIAETLDITIWVVQTDRVDKYNEKHDSQISPEESQSAEIIKLLFNPGHYALVY